MGVYFDLPTSSRTIRVEGVIVFIIGLFPIVESEVTRGEFPPIVGSPRTYFRETYFDGCLFVVLN